MFDGIQPTGPELICWPGPCWNGKPIMALPAGLYRRNDGGESAWHCCVWDGGLPIDVAAVPDAEPLRIFTMRGVAIFMGHENFDRADIEGERLRLVRDPRQWVAGGGDGACVLDWFTAAPLLARLGSIKCDDREHAAYVESRLTPWGCPALYYPRNPA